MAAMENPYRSLPAKAFWRPAVAERHFSGIDDVAAPIDLKLTDRIATAGSCFAQHIGRNLRNSGANYLDMEPAPPHLSREEGKRHGFALYSCRYGNVYTVKQLRQLFEEALGERTPDERVWTSKGRHYDALRPSVDPVGHDSAETILKLRGKHLAAVREMMRQADVFVFTLGLTESWSLKSDGTTFPVVPGTTAGEFDPDKYVFQNFRYPEIIDDLNWCRAALKAANPHVRMILTVSPVPLTATASGGHVLTSTVYSKSTLRAVAGDMAREHADVFYFPSYELIASHPMRGAFFNPDLRTVNDYGVDLVMRQFFKSAGLTRTSPENAPKSDEEEGVICDEEKLEKQMRLAG